MLNKEKTANWARLKYLLAVPLGVGLLCASTLGFSKSYGFVEIGERKQVQQKASKNKQEKPVYYPEHRYDEKNNFISLEKRAIIVNGKVVADKNKYYGVAEADEIKYLNTAEATKKYGSKIGKNGAVVITGKNLVNTPPPPMMPLADQANPTKIKKDQVKFPPPVVKKNKTRTGTAIVKPDQVKFPTTYYPKYKHDKEGNYISLEERLIVVNGKIIADKNKYHGTAEADKIIFLNRKDAIKKYGSEEGKNGAVEIYGEKAVFTFPPPIVKPDKERVKEQIKTGALKKDRQEITSAKETFQKTNNVFNKAWTLYKPKVEENKNDKC